MTPPFAYMTEEQLSTAIAGYDMLIAANTHVVIMDQATKKYNGSYDGSIVLFQFGYNHVAKPCCVRVSYNYINNTVSVFDGRVDRMFQKTDIKLTVIDINDRLGK